MKTKLEYQAGEARRSWRWGRWIFVVTMIALGVTAWRVAPTVVRHMALTKLQEQCLQDVPPAGQAVFDTRADSLPSMKRSDPRFVSGHLLIGSLMDAVFKDPSGAPSTSRLLSYIAWRPKAWDQYLIRSGLGQMNEVALIAVRRLRNHQGQGRLVALRLDGRGAVWPRVFRLASPLENPVELPGPETVSETIVLPQADAFAIFCNPPDPAHPDCITFRVATNTLVTTWEARLGEADFVRLVQTGENPITPPPPTSQASSH